MNTDWTLARDMTKVYPEYVAAKRAGNAELAQRRRQSMLDMYNQFQNLQGMQAKRQEMVQSAAQEARTTEAWPYKMTGIREEAKQAPMITQQTDITTKNLQDERDRLLSENEAMKAQLAKTGQTPAMLGAGAKIAATEQATETAKLGTEEAQQMRYQSVPRAKAEAAGTEAQLATEVGQSQLGLAPERREAVKTELINAPQLSDISVTQAQGQAMLTGAQRDVALANANAIRQQIDINDYMKEVNKQLAEAKAKSLNAKTATTKLKEQGRLAVIQALIDSGVDEQLALRQVAEMPTPLQCQQQIKFSLDSKNKISDMGDDQIADIIRSFGKEPQATKRPDLAKELMVEYDKQIALYKWYLQLWGINYEQPYTTEKATTVNPNLQDEFNRIMGGGK